MSAIIKAVADVMGKVGSVEKKGKNEFHRYNYATAADIQHKLQPLLASAGLVIFQNEVSRDFIANNSAVAVQYSFTLAHSSGEIWHEKPIHTGVSAALNTKGGFDDKCINKTYTAARKYFLLALFQIPTGDYDDPDGDEDTPSNSEKSDYPHIKKSENSKHESPPPPPDKRNEEVRARTEDAKNLIYAIKDCKDLNEMEATKRQSEFVKTYKSLPEELRQQVGEVISSHRISLSS